MHRLLPVPFLLLTACSIAVEPDRFESFVPTDPVELVVVEEGVGLVDVVGAEFNEVEVQVAIYGTATEWTPVVADGVLTLTAVCGGPKCAVDYRIALPRDVAIAVQTDSGSIRLDGVTGDVVANSDSGSVRVDGTGGEDTDLRVLTDSGSVELDDFRGDRLRIQTGSGSVDAEELLCLEADVETESGGIELLWDAPPAAVEVESESGSVLVEVPIGPYAVNVISDSGSVDLRGLQDDPTADATIDVRTDSGSVLVEGR